MLYSQIESTNNAITSFLKSNGIPESEFSVNAPQVNDLQADRYGNQTVPYRYIVTTVVVVTSSQVKKINELMEKQTQLMQQGIAVVAGDYNYQTLYEFTDLNKVKPEMIAEATKNAREAANKFAEDSESRLGKIKTASQGQFSIEDRDQYTPYIKRVRVVSSIQYYLKDWQHPANNCFKKHSLKYFVWKEAPAEPLFEQNMKQKKLIVVPTTNLTLTLKSNTMKNSLQNYKIFLKHAI